MTTHAPPGTNLAPRFERNRRGRDLVVGDVHGHFETLRHALAEPEVGERDRVFSLGDLVDLGPHSWEAIDWMAGGGERRFDLVLRGNHEQMMLGGLEVPEHLRWRKSSPYAWDVWARNGGTWWRGPRATEDAKETWSHTLHRLPYCARVETALGSVGLVHASPVCARWEELEDQMQSHEWPGDLTRRRALWSRVRHGWQHRDLLEDSEDEYYLGPVEGVEYVVTGHTPIPDTRPTERRHDAVVGRAQGDAVKQPSRSSVIAQRDWSLAAPGRNRLRSRECGNSRGHVCTRASIRRTSSVGSLAGLRHATTLGCVSPTTTIPRSHSKARLVQPRRLPSTCWSI